MCPKITKITLILPWTPPQDVLCRVVLPGVYRMSLLDRFERRIQYVGSDIGFGIRLFKSTMNQSYVVVKGEWDEALYKDPAKAAVKVEILEVSSDDH